MSRAKLIFLIPALLYSGIILYLSLINLADTPVSEIGVSDKVMHVGAYFGLGLIWIFYILDRDPKKIVIQKILIICLAGTAFGIFIEVLQDKMTLYREMDLYDIIANTIGVILAAIVAWLLKDYLIRLKANIYLLFIKK